MQNFIKTILSGVQTWTKGKIKESITASTADWNQNDSSTADYVKNRTHWEEKKSIYLIPEMTVSISEDGGYETLSGSCPVLTVGQTYTVILNGVTYNCVARLYNEDDALIGNGEVYGEDGKGNGEPFAIDSYDDGWIYLNVVTAGEYTVSISMDDTVIHKLDSKYLDLPTNVATTDDVQEAVEIAQSIADGKMDANNPVGTGSFSMNRMAGTTVGDNSHAEGSNTTASGNNSHAEGDNTTASGNNSHAEGNSTTAMGWFSHAEGDQTVAQGNSQHVQGKYNILDVVEYQYEMGKYAHIVGNGIDAIKRSNAHTLDWNGVGWYQGGLQVGGNAQDDGAKNVLLEGDAIPVPVSATVGQTIAVKSVNENGIPIEWETVDFPGEDKYELIETIVCDGTYGNISRTKLSLKKVKIALNMKAASAATTVCIEAYNDAGLFGYSWLGNCINTGERFATSWFVSDGMNAYAEFTSPGSTKYNTGGVNRTAYPLNADTPINRLGIYTSPNGNVFPAESTIEIWGVRA